MGAAKPAPVPSQGDRLQVAMRKVLGHAMGVRRQWSPGVMALGPTRSALIWLACYAVVWWGLVEPVASWLEAPREPRMVALLAWGACYFAAAIYLAQETTARIFETVERDIRPYCTPAFRARVAADLDRRFTSRVVLGVPLTAGLLAIGLGLAAIHRDIGIGTGVGRFAPELLLWGVSYYFYFIAAAHAVVAARFSLSFLNCLERKPPPLYLMAASETPLVQGVARLAELLLGFWIKIFLLVLSSMLLAVVPLGFGGSSTFLFVLIPIAGFFSLGMGSVAYLETERRLRALLRRFTSNRAAKLQQEINALLDDPGCEPAAVQRLTDRHDRILAGGRHSNAALAALSILLPWLPLLLSLIQFARGWL